MNDRTYLVPDAHFEARVWPHTGDITVHRTPPMDGIKDGSTTTWSATEAKALAYAILALLSGSFDSAVSEAYLQTLANRKKLWEGGNRPPSSTPPASPAIKPNLDML
jgi:hypothetical protein